MRFALLGNHPDGVELAFALVESGRHSLVSHTAPLAEQAVARLRSPRRVNDVEEVLADPEVEAVIVAGVPEYRPEQLRRALQSERSVLCVHPADQTPEIGYEAAMIQTDTGAVLLPILARAGHPAVRRLGALLAAGKGPTSVLGDVRLLCVEWASEGEVLENLQFGETKPSFPGWEVLRALGGEIAEVIAYAAGEELLPGDPVLLSGRFESGVLFQVTLLPCSAEATVRLTARGSRGEAELLLPLGWQGPAILSIARHGEEPREEYWERWDPWPAMVEQFETALAGRRALPSAGARSAPVPEGATGIQTEAPARRAEAVTPEPSRAAPRDQAALPGMSSWQEEIRCLELDDAARRAVKYRRAQALEYPEASEEAGFKGTMTLVGCGMLWATLLLLLLARWLPSLGALIAPLFLFFLVLQLLRYVIPSKPER